MLCALILLLLYFFHPIPLQGVNVDIGHHLLLGKIILKQGHVPDTNIFSYIAPDFPYINTNWLSEVIFFKSFERFGYNGLIFLGIGLILTSFILLLCISDIKKDYFSVFIVLLIYEQIIIDRTEVKPELFSLLLLSIYLLLLYEYKRLNRKFIYILPFLQIVWANLHFFFIVGSSITGLFLLDEIIQHKYSLRNKSVLELGLVTVLCFLANLVNPHFLKGAIYPFMVFNNYGYKVIENYNFLVSIQYKTDITFFYFIFAFIFLWSCIILYRKKLKLIDIFLSIFFSFLGLYAVRNFSLFVIGTFIPCVKVTQLLHKKLETIYDDNKIINIKIVLVISLIIFISPAVIWSFSVHGFGEGVIDEAADAVTMLKKNNVKGAMYNNYNIGNYLEYKVYPEKVFVNGSPEAYPQTFFKNVYYPIDESFVNFTNASKQYNFKIVFYDHVNQTINSNQLLTHLIRSTDWKLVYVNNRVIVFIKNIDENKEFINSHLITESNLELKITDTNSRDKLQTLSNLFRVLGWYEKMYEMDLKYLDYDANSCVALRHVVFFMSKTNNPLKNIYFERFQENCK